MYCISGGAQCWSGFILFPLPPFVPLVGGCQIGGSVWCESFFPVNAKSPVRMFNHKVYETWDICGFISMFNSPSPPPPKHEQAGGLELRVFSLNCPMKRLATRRLAQEAIGAVST